AAGRADGEAAQRRERLATLGELHDRAEAPLAFEDVRDRAAARGRLDGVLDVLDVDRIPRRRLAVDDDLQLRLADEVIVVEIRDAADTGEHAGDLAGLRLQREDVEAVELDGQLTLHAGQRFVDVVLDRLREVHRDAGDV